MSDLLRLFIDADFYVMLLQLATPLIFAALAALFSDRAGVINISIEGTMLMSALAGAIFSSMTNNGYVGILMAVVMGIAMGYVFALCVLYLKADNILTGIALNLFCAGLAILVVYAITGNKSDYPSVAIASFSIPLLKDIPFIGKILFQDIDVLTYIAIILVFASAYVFKKTVLGLRIRSVGKNEQAAASVGINPNKVKTIALVIAGGLAGLGGAYMSLGYMSSFNTGMIAGRGFIGLAAEAIGGGNPYLTALFALLFGAVNALSLTAQTFSSVSIPYELLNTLPYIVTIIGMVVYAMVKIRKAKKRRILKKEAKYEKSLGD